MKLRSLAAFAVMSAVLAVPAKAHHSFNTFFDMSKTIAIEGVIDILQAGQSALRDVG